jgi:ADP-dependent NAD(P)H-hydrate dehydratase
MSTPPPVLVTEELLRAWPLPAVSTRSDKEGRGRVVIVAGCAQMPGAPVLTAQAALRAGAGKVLVLTAQSVATAVGIAVPELRVVGLPETADGGLVFTASSELLASLARADALLIGPGMQDEEATATLVESLRSHGPDVPTLLDAVALSAVRRRPTDRARVLITPHAGEMARLRDDDKDQVQAAPLQIAMDAARRWNAVVALKGAHTHIAHCDGRSWSHGSGHEGLATAGSGDVLAGLMAGLMARGASLEQAAVWGVVLHAQAGHRLAERMGRLGFLAHELAAEVPRLLDDFGDVRTGQRPDTASNPA